MAQYYGDKPDEQPKDAEDILADARKAFKEAADSESDNRLEYEDDIRFARLGEQWPEGMRAKREKADRPCLTINRMPSFIRQVVNDARQNKPSIKVRPVDSKADIDTADKYSGLIRHIEYSSNAEIAYDTAIEGAVGGGFGYFRITLDYAYEDTFDLDIKIEPCVDPMLVFGDPASTDYDSANWCTAFIVESLTKDEFERRYGEKKRADWDDYTAIKEEGWYDSDMVRVAEWWKREEYSKPIFLMTDGSVYSQEKLDEPIDMPDGSKVPFMVTLGLDGVQIKDQRITKCYRVYQHILSGAELLEYNQWPGQYIPIVPVYGDVVVIGGKRHLRSLIRDAKDPQRMFNYWRTASTELVALAPKAPFIGAVGQFATDSKWATANTETHQFLEYDAAVPGAAGPPQRQPFTGPPMGALQEAMNASDDMKAVMGLYDASLGKQDPQAASGRAILARMREGDVSTFHFTDNMARAIRHAGRILIDLIPKVYTPERIIRILGEDGTPDQIPLGQPTPVKGPNNQPVMEPAMNPMGQPMMDPTTQQPVMQPKTRVYDLTIGKYDLTVTTGPSYTTRREEAATQMLQMIQANPAVAPIIGDLIAKNLDWPNSEEIAERLNALLPPQVKGGLPPEVDQMIKQGQQMIQDLQSENTFLKTTKEVDQQKVQVQGQAVQVDAFNAQTKRMETEAKIAADAAERMQMAPPGLPPEIIDGIGKMQAELARLSAENTQLRDDRYFKEKGLDIQFYGEVTKRLALRLDALEAATAAAQAPSVEGETPAAPVINGGQPPPV